MKRLAVVPARGGSKRIPNKNIRDFCGRPMIAHVLAAARDSGLFETIHVSTESDSIRSVAEKLGFPPDFSRPDSLAGDHAPIMPVLKYVLEEYLNRGISFDSVVLLMACAPLITQHDLREASKLFDSYEGKRSVLAVAEYPCPVEWAFRREPNGVLKPVQPGMFSMRSQDLESAYYDAGQFCFMPSERIYLSEGAGTDDGFVGFPIRRHQAIDIDTHDDWKFAEMIYKSLQERNE